LCRLAERRPGWELPAPADARGNAIPHQILVDPFSKPVMTSRTTNSGDELMHRAHAGSQRARTSVRTRFKGTLSSRAKQSGTHSHHTKAFASHKSIRITQSVRVHACEPRRRIDRLTHSLHTAFTQRAHPLTGLVILKCAVVCVCVMNGEHRMRARGCNGCMRSRRLRPAVCVDGRMRWVDGMCECRAPQRECDTERSILVLVITSPRSPLTPAFSHIAKKATSGNASWSPRSHYSQLESVNALSLRSLCAPGIVFVRA
jgi:hypothetical protein